MTKDPKVYVKYIGRRGKIRIYIVDGVYVRGHVNEEFTNFGHHYLFKMIPEFEFWIDREQVTDERRFFVDHMLTEWRLMREGVTFSLAHEQANARERSERMKAGDFVRNINKEGGVDLDKIHKELIGHMVGGLKVWLVSGRLVRSLYYIDFTQGGHSRVYDFVPSDEVWIDDDLVRAEWPYVILHEGFERHMMGGGIVYWKAHRMASKKEWKARHSDEYLERELGKLSYREEKK